MCPSVILNVTQLNVGRVAPLTRFDPEPRLTSTPNKKKINDSLLRYDDVSGREEAESTQNEKSIVKSTPQRWEEMTWVNKYVDDLSAGEKICLADSVSRFSQNKEERHVRAFFCEELHKRVEENCDKIGMRMNAKKTQLLCVTAAINYEVRSFVEIGGKKIISGDSLNILGFTFGRRPTMRPHFEAIRKKYIARTHIIRHLKKVGLSSVTLCKIYCSLIRPVIEFAAQVYHHMLSDDVSEEIEKLQRSVLKTIFGFKTSYACALEKSGLCTLDERRRKLCLKFALDSEKNPRYKHWFPAHDRYAYNVRQKSKFKEEFALRD